jgi:mRNA interferase RelE/StbE
VTYELFFWPAAKRALRKLPREIRQKIGPMLEELRHTPRPVGAEKLSGHTRRWRIKTGDYRVVYEVDDDKRRVIVVTAGHRGSVYRDQ